MPLVTLITGASSGFGNILAYQLAHAGHQVYATMRDSAGRNAQAAAELSQVPGVRVVELDVASESSVTAAVGPILRKAGRIDVTVNNAGFGTFGIAEAFTVE